MNDQVFCQNKCKLIIITICKRSFNHIFNHLIKVLVKIVRKKIYSIYVSFRFRVVSIVLRLNREDSSPLFQALLIFSVSSGITLNRSSTMP